MPKKLTYEFKLCGVKDRREQEVTIPPWTKTFRVKVKDFTLTEAKANAESIFQELIEEDDDLKPYVYTLEPVMAEE